MKRKIVERTIYFPWERSRSRVARLGLSRTRPVLAGLAVIGLMTVLALRERTKIGIRQSRATLGVVGKAVDGFRADHDGKCPDDLAELRRGGYLAFDPKDAWGRPFRLICPGFSNPTRYDLISDGPDGAFGGLDRIE